MAKRINLTDEQGRKWHIWLREWPASHIKNQEQLYKAKQRHADYERGRGNERVAESIEKHSLMEWMRGEILSTCIIQKAIRLDDNGKEVR